MKCDKKDVNATTPFAPESPNVIVCEGLHENNLICKLLESSGIDNCDVTYSRNGKDGIPSLLELLGGRSEVTGLLIVRDADDDPAAAFKSTATTLREHFIAPDAPFVIAKKKTRKSAVFLNPGKDKTGALEHLLLSAVELVSPEAIGHVQEYATRCGGTDTWPANEQAKMKLACYTATHCAQNPTCSPAYLFQEKYRVIDIESTAFDEIRQFIVDFSQLYAPEQK